MCRKMSISFVAGREVWLLLMAIALFTIALSTWMQNNNRKYDIRTIGALTAVDEAVARCAEMGRPVMVSLGKREIDHRESTSAVPLLSYVATKCAELGSELIACTSQPAWQPLAESVVYEAYKAAGKEGEFKLENVRFISPKGYAYVTGMIGIVNREEVATTFMFGGYGGEQLILSEAAGIAGSMVVAINAVFGQVYGIIVSADYATIGEEGHAASAILGDERQRIDLLGSDVLKAVSIGYGILGLILKIVGVW